MTMPTPINCQEALRLLATYLDHELHGAEHDTLERHLSTCRSCYSRAEFERRLKAELGRLRQEDVPAAFEQRIRQLIAGFASGTATGPSEA